MSRRKRSPKALATAITIGADMVVEPTYEADPDGRPVVQKHAPEKTEEQCREIIKAWLKSELLMVEKYESRKERKQFDGLRVDAAKRPGTGAQ